MEDCAPLLTELRGDKPKALRMLPIVTNNTQLCTARYGKLARQHHGEASDIGCKIFHSRTRALMDRILPVVTKTMYPCLAFVISRY
jgi:hypothetical protein